VSAVRAIPLRRKVLGELGVHGVLLASIGLAMMAIGFIELRARAAHADGVSTARGVIEALWVEYAVGETRKAAFSYYDGRRADPIHKVERVTEDHYAALFVGAPVEVAFDPAIPGSGHLKTEPREGLSRIFLTLGFFALGGGAAQLTLRARQAQGMRRLMAEGRMVEARVVRVFPTALHINRERQHRLEYQFFSPDGQWRHGLSAFAPARAMGGLRAGDPVHVFVDPAAPEKHVLARDVLEVA
jgi:hypothetical protein